MEQRIPRHVSAFPFWNSYSATETAPVIHNTCTSLLSPRMYTLPFQNYGPISEKSLLIRIQYKFQDLFVFSLKAHSE